MFGLVKCDTYEITIGHNSFIPLTAFIYFLAFKRILAKMKLKEKKKMSDTDRKSRYQAPNFPVLHDDELPEG